MNKIGIMGGRLSSPIENEIQCFPHHNWQEEFRLLILCVALPIIMITITYQTMRYWIKIKKL